jgi:hypothetical protein
LVRSRQATVGTRREIGAETEEGDPPDVELLRRLQQEGTAPRAVRLVCCCHPGAARGLTPPRSQTRTGSGMSGEAAVRRAVGLFVRDGSIALDDCYAEELAVILPVRFGDGSALRLLAAWPKAPVRALPGYVRRMHVALDRYGDFITSGDTLVVGDFNSDTIWDDLHRPNHHSALVARLADLGLTSVYHALRGEHHGGETLPTYFYWRRHDRAFHIDFLFAPTAWIGAETTIHVGTFDDWISASDHVPLVVTSLGASL